MFIPPTIPLPVPLTDDAIEAMTTVEFIDGDERSAELNVLVG